MGKYLVVLALFFFQCKLDLSAKDKSQPFYPADIISKSLTKNANAVYRNYEHTFELIDFGKATEKIKLVVTILNENGESFCRLSLPYDRSQKITEISGRSYNALGIPLETLKSSSIQDLNYTSGGALYDDVRMKFAELKSNKYPYTIEFQVEIQHSELIQYPTWCPIDQFQLSVEKSTLKVIFPENLGVRYREFYLPENARKELKENDKTCYEWKVDSLTALLKEPLAPAITRYTPHVILAPVAFSYHETKGDMSSWKDLGAWCLGLSNGLDVLPEPRQKEIKNLTGAITDTLQVIQTLYKYMQHRTRYVGIQLGLGGYKPFSAETVDRLGYGDCKALSNYMKALLSCVGIKSLYTLAGAGDNEGIVLPDFPTINQNNHAILCVPLAKDTIWLECTSQTQPMGYLGTFSGDRVVLLIKPEGGVLAKTPKLTVANNLQRRVGSVKINSDGSMLSHIETRYAGYQFDNVSALLDQSKEDQKKELLKNYSIPGLVIDSFGFAVKNAKIPDVTESIDVTVVNYASKTGTRLFIPVNKLNRITESPKTVELRRLPVIQKMAYKDVDSLVFELPSGYVTESIPKVKSIKTDFGEYTSSVTINKNTATYVRKMQMKKGIWPKERYAEFVSFYSEIVAADNANLVLKSQ